MKNTIFVPLKDHVSQYFTQRYGEPVRIPRGELLHGVVQGCLTIDVSKRYIRDANQRHVRVSISNSLSSRFLHRSKAKDLASSFDKQYWIDLINFVGNHLRTVPRSNKRVAIMAFYEAYGITDDMYPYDSVRRRLTREGLFNVHPSPGVPVRHNFRAVSNNQARQIHQYHREGVNYRELSRIYNISLGTVHNVVSFYKKISA